jgi:hypothetical protein
VDVGVELFVAKVLFCEFSNEVKIITTLLAYPGAADVDLALIHISFSQLGYLRILHFPYDALPSRLPYFLFSQSPSLLLLVKINGSGFIKETVIPILVRKVVALE